MTLNFYIRFNVFDCTNWAANESIQFSQINIVRTCDRALIDWKQPFYGWYKQQYSYRCTMVPDNLGIWERKHRKGRSKQVYVQDVNHKSWRHYHVNTFKVNITEKKYGGLIHILHELKKRNTVEIVNDINLKLKNVHKHMHAHYGYEHIYVNVPNDYVEPNARCKLLWWQIAIGLQLCVSFVCIQHECARNRVVIRKIKL